MLRMAFFVGTLAALIAGCGGADETAPDEIPPGDPRYERDPALDVDNISKHGESRSHNVGKNCMGCHQQHGPGKGLFTVAGTLYGPDQKPHANGTLEMWTEPFAGGKLVIAVEADELGNFFTTEEMPFPDEELFPYVRSKDGTTTNGMPFPTSSGACNICHNEQRRVVIAPEG